MAALVCFVYGVGVQVFEIVRQCSESGWSIRTLIDTIEATHNGILARQYLANIDRIYGDDSTAVSHSIGIECFNCRPSNMSHREMWDEVEGYVQVDDAVEAFEVISNKVTFFLIRRRQQPQQATIIVGVIIYEYCKKKKTNVRVY